MKRNFPYAILPIVGLLLASCIRHEAPDAEADILRCILPDSILTDTETDYSLPFDDALEAYPLYIEVKAGTSLSALSPLFELSSGASIQPANGSMHDFTYPVYYTVTSEDKKWQRKYAVSIQYPNTSQLPTFFHFEQVERQDNYYLFYEDAPDGHRFTWASGNQGFALTGNASTPDSYPTTLSSEGYIGNCALLTTRTTGSLGEKVGKPIAAGNLFIGKFELLNALGDALAATKFGATFTYQPTLLTGYYKYKAGPEFYEDGVYTLRKDTFSIYALFYEKTGDMPLMDGHLPANGFNSPQMVALALLPSEQAVETEEWTYFEIPFDYDRYNHPVDSRMLAEGGYQVAIICSSSKDGDEFRGAPGSVLMIDEVKLIYE